MRRLRGFTSVVGGLLGISLGVLILILGVFNAGVTTPPAWAQSSCGNSIVEAGEECDPPGSSCSGAFAGQICEAGCTCGSPTAAILRHFQCYEIRPPQRIAPFSVNLHDQFADGDVTIKKVFSVCAPANKNNEDPDAVTDGRHLVSYGIKSVGKTAKVFNQHVTDQFGAINVDVVKRARLLVPTAKSLVGPPASPEPGLLDHFACYKVKRTSGSPRFDRQDGVTIQTQFETVTVDVKKPLRLCAPVSKNDEDDSVINRPAETEDHLMCYRVKASTGFPTTAVFTANQFGTTAYSISQRREFCVPARKNFFGTTTTTSTSTSTSSTSSTSTSSTSSTSTSTSSTSSTSTSSTSSTSTSSSTSSSTSTSSTTSSSTSVPTTSSTSTSSTTSSSTSTTSTTSTSTTSTTAPNCCANTQLAFTVGTGSGNCGTVVQTNGAPIAGANANLACGNLYIGTGSSGLPGNPTPPAAGGSSVSGTTITTITTCNAGTGAMTLGPRTFAQTGDLENCSAAGCKFGAPLPIPNPTSTPTSTCVINYVGSFFTTNGTANCNTGTASVNIPLDSHVYLEGDLEPEAGIQTCPTCQSGVCQSGPNSGVGCTPDSGDPGPVPQYPTSSECPPPGAGFLGIIQVPFSLTTGSTTKTAANTDGSGGQARVFCGLCRDANGTNGFGVCAGGSNAGNPCQFTTDCPSSTCGATISCTSNAGCPTDLCDDGVTPCHNDNDCVLAGASACNMDQQNREICQQRDNGAFGQATSNTISLTGTPAGDLSDGLGHASTLVSIFCIDPTYDGSVDGAGGLPGPGAVSLPGVSQVLP